MIDNAACELTYLEKVPRSASSALMRGITAVYDALLASLSRSTSKEFIDRKERKGWKEGMEGQIVGRVILVLWV